MRIIKDRKAKFVSLGIKINPKDWNDELARVRKSYPNSQRMNNFIAHKIAEAEAVALLCIESLGLTGSEYCRGYIQSWLKGNKIPEKSAQKIITAADKILKAGA